MITKGTVRDDGKIFWCYTHHKSEYWVTPELYQKKEADVKRNVDSKREAFTRIDRKRKRGEVRADGKVFWRYSQRSPNFESWISKEKYDKLTNKPITDEDREKRNAYARRKRLECKKTRLSERLRKRVWSAFNGTRFKSSKRSHDLLGCSYEDLVIYFEGLFHDGMSWDRMSEIHIDHIIPLASGNTEEELEVLCHYTNLQPLWAKDNLSKGDRIA